MQTLLIISIILLGFALIMADLLFIPGGIVAILGGTLVAGAIVSAFRLLGQEAALYITGGSILLAVLLTYISIKFRLWKIFVLNQGENKQEGFASHKGNLEQLITSEGQVITDLRPSGTIEIQGRKYDGVTEGDFIETGKRIKVIGVSTGQLKVRQIENK